MLYVTDMIVTMIVTRRVTFRLYPNKSQEAKMHYWRRLHKDLFNDCLAERKTACKREGRSIGYFDKQNALPKFKEHFQEYKQLLASAQADIRKASRELRRKRKPQKRKAQASRRWKKARKKVSKFQNQVASRRQDWTHKVAAQIVRDHSLVATETLNVKNMTRQTKKSKRKRQKTGLNRSILDVGLGMLRSAIKYKVEEAGGFFVEVPAQKIKPSQTCPKCLAQKKKELSERIHCCENCGCTLDRDVASAIVSLNYAKGLGTSLKDVEQKALAKTPNKCGGFSQLCATKRQKPRT